jgi:hypothetical protein
VLMILLMLVRGTSVQMLAFGGFGFEVFELCGLCLYF